jgi:hypothetical protein
LAAAATEHDLGQLLVRSVRYALAYTSVNSIAANFVPELAARALECGIWDLDRAMREVTRKPDLRTQVAAYAALAGAKVVGSADRRRLLDMAYHKALGTGDVLERVLCVKALAPALDNDQLGGLLDAALAIDDDKLRALALIAVSPRLPGDVKERVAAGLGAFTDAWPLASVIEALGPAVAVAAPELFERARSFDERSHAKLLTVLAEHLPADAIQAMLERALAFNDELAKQWVLCLIAESLADSDLERATDAARRIHDNGTRARALAALAARYEGDQRQSILDDALMSAQQAGVLMSDLVRVALQLPPEQQQQVFAAALHSVASAKDDGHKRFALEQLVPAVPLSLLEETMRIARSPDTGAVDANLLYLAAQRLDGDRRMETLGKALFSAIAIDDDLVRARALQKVGPHLTGDMLEIALDAILQITDSNGRERGIAAVAPNLSSDMAKRALTALTEIDDVADRLASLDVLQTEWPITLSERALAYTVGIRQRESRVSSLGILVSHLTGSELLRALREARTLGASGCQAILWAVTRRVSPIWALGASVPPWSVSLVGKMVQILEHSHADATLTDVVAQLEQPWAQSGKLDDVLQRALAQPTDLFGKIVLPTLPVLLPRESFVTAFEAVLAVEDPPIGTLTAFAIHLKASEVSLTPQLATLVKRSVAAARARVNDLCDTSDWLTRLKELEVVDLFRKLIPVMTDSLVLDALAVSRHMSTEAAKSRAFAALLPRLPAEQRDIVVEDALAIRDETARADVIAAAAPLVSTERRRSLLIAAEQLGNHAARAQALRGFLTSSLDPDVLRAVRVNTVRHLSSFETVTRADVLRFCRGELLQDTRVWPAETRTAVANAVVEICFDWAW